MPPVLLNSSPTWHSLVEPLSVSKNTSSRIRILLSVRGKEQASAPHSSLNGEGEDIPHSIHSSLRSISPTSPRSSRSALSFSHDSDVTIPKESEEKTTVRHESKGALDGKRNLRLKDLSHSRSERSVTQPPVAGLSSSSSIAIPSECYSVDISVMSSLDFSRMSTSARTRSDRSLSPVAMSSPRALSPSPSISRVNSLSPNSSTNRSTSPNSQCLSLEESGYRGKILHFINESSDAFGKYAKKAKPHLYRQATLLPSSDDFPHEEFEMFSLLRAGENDISQSQSQKKEGDDNQRTEKKLICRSWLTGLLIAHGHAQWKVMPFL
jgi:hypothetical protein